MRMGSHQRPSFRLGGQVECINWNRILVMSSTARQTSQPSQDPLSTWNVWFLSCSWCQIQQFSQADGPLTNQIWSVGLANTEGCSSLGSRAVKMVWQNQRRETCWITFHVFACPPVLCSPCMTSQEVQPQCEAWQKEACAVGVQTSWRWTGRCELDRDLRTGVAPWTSVWSGDQDIPSPCGAKGGIQHYIKVGRKRPCLLTEHVEFRFWTLNTC